MKKQDLLFIAIALAVLGTFIFLSVIGRKAPTMTTRSEHEGMGRNTPRDSCVVCHDPGSDVAPISFKVDNPKQKKHPKKGVPPDTTTCFACHQPPSTGAVAMQYGLGKREPTWLNQWRK